MKHKQNSITYRRIAKMLASRMPGDDDDFAGKVADFLEAIKRLPQPQKQALKVAYIFSRKVPTEDREDMFQDLILALLESKACDEPLQYTIARCDWRNWWEKYRLHQHYLAGSLNREIIAEDGTILEFAELLVGECEFERKAIAKLDAHTLYNGLPKWVQDLVNKRLRGHGISGGNRMMLDKWILQRPTILASYQS